MDSKTNNDSRHIYKQDPRLELIGIVLLGGLLYLDLSGFFLNSGIIFVLVVLGLILYLLFGITLDYKTIAITDEEITVKSLLKTQIIRFNQIISMSLNTFTGGSPIYRIKTTTTLIEIPIMYNRSKFEADLARYSKLEEIEKYTGPISLFFRPKRWAKSGEKYIPTGMADLRNNLFFDNRLFSLKFAILGIAIFAAYIFLSRVVFN